MEQLITNLGKEFSFDANLNYYDYVHSIKLIFIMINSYIIYIMFCKNYKSKKELKEMITKVENENTLLNLKVNTLMEKLYDCNDILEKKINHLDNNIVVGYDTQNRLSMYCNKNNFNFWFCKSFKQNFYVSLSAMKYFKIKDIYTPSNLENFFPLVVNFLPTTFIDDTSDDGENFYRYLTIRRCEDSNKIIYFDEKNKFNIDNMKIFMSILDPKLKLYYYTGQETKTHYSSIYDNNIRMNLSEKYGNILVREYIESFFK